MLRLIRAQSSTTSFFVVLALAIMTMARSTADAQSAQSGRNSYEVGVDFGTLLPSRIRLRELVPGWAVRASSPTRGGIFEAHFFSGLGNGIIYRTVGVDYRIDTSVETIPAHFLIGFHADQFEQGTPAVSVPFAGGWHYGGGISQEIAGPLLMRFNFRHRFSPGQVLEVTLGFTYRFAAESGGG